MHSLFHLCYSEFSFGFSLKLFYPMASSRPRPGVILPRSASASDSALTSAPPFPVDHLESDPRSTQEDVYSIFSASLLEFLSGLHGIVGIRTELNADAARFLLRPSLLDDLEADFPSGKARFVIFRFDPLLYEEYRVALRESASKPRLLEIFGRMVRSPSMFVFRVRITLRGTTDFREVRFEFFGSNSSHVDPLLRSMGFLDEESPYFFPIESCQHSYFEVADDALATLLGWGDMVLAPVATRYLDMFSAPTDDEEEPSPRPSGSSPSSTHSTPSRVSQGSSSEVEVLSHSASVAEDLSFQRRVFEAERAAEAAKFRCDTQAIKSAHELELVKERAFHAAAKQAAEYEHSLTLQRLENERLSLALQLAQAKASAEVPGSLATASSASSSSSSSAAGLAISTTSGELANVAHGVRLGYLYSDAPHHEAIVGPDPSRAHFPTMAANMSRVLAAHLSQLQAGSPGGYESSLLSALVEANTADRQFTAAKQMVLFKLSPSTVCVSPPPASMNMSYFLKMFSSLSIKFAVYGDDYPRFFPLLLQEYLHLHVVYDFSLEGLFQDLERQFTRFYWPADRDPEDDAWLRERLSVFFLPSRRPADVERMHQQSQALRLRRVEDAHRLQHSNSSSSSRSSPSSSRSTPSPGLFSDPSGYLFSPTQVAARKAMGAPPIPALMPQPGHQKTSSGQPRPAAHPCWLWVKKGCPSGHCGTVNCWRFHHFHPQESAAVVEEYKAWVNQYVQL